MPLLDFNARTVQLRFALLGPAGAGKRTMLRRLHSLAVPETGPALEARTVGPVELLSFSYTPESVEPLDGHRLTAEVFTLSATPAHGALFDHLLADLDAVLFVADSRPQALPANAAALRRAGAHALVEEVPVVIFYNQRDLPDRTPIAQLQATLNSLGTLSFGGSALTGAGLAPLLDSLIQIAFATRR